MTDTQPHLPLHLAGNNAPVADEVEVTELRVTGAIPEFLEGTFYRNGPNPRTGWSAHLFDGDGMVHALEIAGGRGVRYWNRSVRTPLYEHPGISRFDLAYDRQTSTLDYRVSTANTSIVVAGNRLLALEEGGLPYELTRDLRTVGPFTFGGQLHTPMTAHPKRCPLTGDLLFFGYQLTRPHVTFYRWRCGDVQLGIEPIDLPVPTMMHDFAITESSVVFCDSPIVFDRRAVAAGGSPWRWDDEHPARFGVMPREGAGGDVRWYEVEPGHVSHVANACDRDDGQIEITGTRLPRARDDEFGETGGAGGGLPVMHRWTLDVHTGATNERPLDDVSTEYPRVAEHRTGLRNRFVYTTTFELQATPDHSEILRYDLDDDGSATRHRFPRGHTCGEPVFVARSVLGGEVAADDTEEDDGVVLSWVHDRASDTSYLAILDATDLTAAPLAEVHVPRRVPNGFHGTWVAHD